ncbi:hypothetical protein ACU686_01345 [Yinghuangia aomiensis]
MDFAYTEEQQELVGLVRQILTERVTHEALTALEAKVTGEGAPRFDRELWGELAKREHPRHRPARGARGPPASASWSSC